MIHQHQTTATPVPLNDVVVDGVIQPQHHHQQHCHHENASQYQPIQQESSTHNRRSDIGGTDNAIIGANTNQQEQQQLSLLSSLLVDNHSSIQSIMKSENNQRVLVTGTLSNDQSTTTTTTTSNDDNSNKNVLLQENHPILLSSSSIVTSETSKQAENNLKSFIQQSQPPIKTTLNLSTATTTTTTTNNNNNNNTTTGSNSGGTLIFHHNFKQQQERMNDVEPPPPVQQRSNNSEQQQQHSIINQPLVFVEQSLSSTIHNTNGQSIKKKNKPKESLPNNFTFHNFAQPPQQSSPIISTINITTSTITDSQQKKSTKFTNYQPSNQTIQFSNYEPVKAQPSTQIVNNHQNSRNITHQFHIAQPPLGQFKITDYSNNYAQPLSHIDYMPSNQILTKNTDPSNPKKRNSTGNVSEVSASKVIKSSKSIVTSNFPTFTNSDFEGCVPSNTFSIHQQQTKPAAIPERKPTISSNAFHSPSANVSSTTTTSGGSINAEQSPKKSSNACTSASSWTFHSFDQTEQPIRDQSTGLTFHSFNPKKK